MVLLRPLSLLFLSSVFTTSLEDLVCTSESQPNPISGQYPGIPTGTINGTVAILEIPLSIARSMIPAKYPILQHVYRSMLPNLAQDMYPAMLQTELDHDVKGSSIPVGGFTRASISFPFVDRLNDNYTSMTYGNHILLSANIVAVVGTAAYGYTVTPASFEPACNAYACLSSSDCSKKTFKAFSVSVVGPVGPKIDQTFAAADWESSPYSLDL